MKSTYEQRVAAAKERAEQERAAAIQVSRQDALAADMEAALDEFAIEGLTDAQVALVAARLVAEGWVKP